MLDFAKFKKIAEDKESTKLKHDDGHTITIVHAYIPKIKREQLKRLKFADGGEIEKPAGTTEKYHEKGKNTPVGKMQREKDLKEYQKSKGPKIQGFADGSPDTVQSDDDSDSQAAPQAPAANITINAAPTPAAQSPMPQNNSAQNFQQQSAQTQPQVPQVQNTAPNVDANGQPLPGNQLKNVQTTAENQANIDTSAAKAQAANEQAIMQARAQQQQTVNDRLNYMGSHVDQFKDYINQNPVQADRRNIGAKVGDAFAIALSGVAGHGNPAMDFLNKQLDRDFQAQKENVNNQNNILGAYERLYGKGVEADKSTLATLIDLYDHKNKQTALQLGTPQALVNSQNISNKLTTEKQKALMDAASQVSQFPGGRGGGSAQKPSGGGSGASNAQPQDGDKRDSANAMPIPGGVRPDQDDLLGPNSEAAYEAAKYSPNTKNQYDKVTNQYSQAVQSQKALDAVNKKFPQLNKEATYSDYLAGKVNPNIVGGIGGLIGGGSAALGAAGLAPVTGGASILGALPGIGAMTALGTGAGEAIGHGAKQLLNATAGQSGLQYDADKAALTKIIAAALRGTNVSSDQIQDVIDSNVPKIVDSKETYNKKMENIKDFIKQNTETSLLDLAGVTKKRQK